SKMFKHPVTVYESTTIDEILPGEVVLIDKDFHKTVIPCDNVVTCWTRPNTGLLEEIKKAGLKVVNVGDSVKPRNLHAAVREGAEAGLALEGNRFINPNDALIHDLPLDVAGQLSR
ncbi:MAG: hypothetical protein JW820_08170, partial [Spirochaetales bacterium]|nr:hypothetical protein [Spirochaetales bacterium]